jgi:predicted ATPase
MARVWPGAIVGENTLQVHMSAIRKALGADRHLLQTSFGRGYRLGGEWTVLREVARSAAAVHLASAAGQPHSGNLPFGTFELIGRERSVRDVQDLLSAYRSVTLTGAGGIGKTALALKVARDLAPNFADGAWMVELAPLSDPALVASAVATALGLKSGGDAMSAASVARAVAGRYLLLLLDNGEHLIDAVAALAEAFVQTCPHASLLTTSREVLRTDGEHVYRVPPLDVPPAGQVDLGRLLEHGSMRLFLARVAAVRPDFTAIAQDLQDIAEICRRLDGIPLAIEFAAARAATLGPQTIAAHLLDRFALLAGGRRTALPRHHTLRATLDWSHDLLTESDRRLLRRLAIFAGGFTLAAAIAVAGDGGSETSIVNGISDLVDKSLVALDVSASPPRWRLLDTTRAYAREKLAESGEAAEVARRHAAYFLESVAPRTAGSAPTLEELAALGRDIDEVRAALDWCFSASGDVATGVALTAAYAPVWFGMLLMAECRERTGRALEMLAPEMQLSAPLHLLLLLMHAHALMYSAASGEMVMPAVAKALELAEGLDDVDTQLRALWVAWNLQLGAGDCGAALSFADRFIAIARRSPERSDILVGERMRGWALVYAGRWGEARQCFGHVLASYVAPSTQRHALFFLHDQHVQARAMLAHVLCMEGFLDQALGEAETCLGQAQGAGNKLAASWAIALAVYPVALNRGDLAAAERALATMTGLATSIGATFWATTLRCLEGKLLLARGEFRLARRALESAIEQFERCGGTFPYTEFMAALAESRAGSGELSEALDTVDRALSFAERGGERCRLPELLRIKGELLLRQAGEQPVSLAERSFAAALAVAREQGALLWELRAAISLARLRLAQDSRNEARDVLAPVYGRFTEGLEAADLRSAKAVLDSL